MDAPADATTLDAAETGPGDSATMDSTLVDGNASAESGTDATMQPEAGDFTMGKRDGLAPGDSLEIEDNGADTTSPSRRTGASRSRRRCPRDHVRRQGVANPQTPTSETCTVMNGTGTVASNNVTDIGIQCTVNGYTLGAETSTGCRRQQLVLQTAAAGTALSDRQRQRRASRSSSPRW